ncbi:hypothetical protein MRX96_021422 [Rhipicephalus microplus]
MAAGRRDAKHAAGDAEAVTPGPPGAFRRPPPLVTSGPNGWRQRLVSKVSKHGVLCCVSASGRKIPTLPT